MRGLIAGVLVLLVFTGCSDHGDPTGVDNPPIIPDPVSLAADIQPLFDSQCVGCHGAGGNAGLDLRSGESYGNLVGVDAVNAAGKLVESGDSMASVLMQRMNGSVGGYMPPAGLLPTTAQELVEQWINDGALDN